MKKKIVIVLLVLMACFLSACGGSSKTVTDSKHLTVEGIYVNNASLENGLKTVYVFYTEKTDDKNMQYCSKDLTMKVGKDNKYSAIFSKKLGRLTPNYYYKEYLGDLYVGNSVKVLGTFKVPESDLTGGKTITFSSHRISDLNQIKMKTDDIVFCDDAIEIAKQADEAGYNDYKLLMEPASAEDTKKVKNSINGYYWTFYVNNTSYRLEFDSPNQFTINAAGLTNNGTYTVTNGYILGRYGNDDNLGFDIPYSWGNNGQIELDVTSAFSVYE